jgi:hypothetical protein
MLSIVVLNIVLRATWEWGLGHANGVEGVLEPRDITVAAGSY